MRAVAIGVLVAVLELDVVLQLGHLAVVLMRSDSAGEGADATRKVLCVGD